ncbi:unnamed protein product [Pleuronectes platessa]|uniref:Uncharacterized protein n=1 Tax=Pleuronectes platessa TaxID=8262 RepID=A0A9N7W396_PLEPL|nr:unnamed protein product [Pleuronectes platessa]
MTTQADDLIAITFRVAVPLKSPLPGTRGDRRHAARDGRRQTPRCRGREETDAKQTREGRRQRSGTAGNPTPLDTLLSHYEQSSTNGCVTCDNLNRPPLAAGGLPSSGTSLKTHLSGPEGQTLSGKTKAQQADYNTS